MRTKRIQLKKETVKRLDLSQAPIVGGAPTFILSAACVETFGCVPEATNG